MKKYILGILSALFSLIVSAQGEAPPSATGGNDFMGGNLKIYVSLAVLTIILVLIFAFLFSMEKRLKKLEGSTPSDDK
jgi:hypothetical protein